MRVLTLINPQPMETLPDGNDGLFVEFVTHHGGTSRKVTYIDRANIVRFRMKFAKHHKFTSWSYTGEFVEEGGEG